MIYDSIIIGAGAAGMTAALNILRNGKTALIIEKEVIGGQIASAPLIENYPAVKEISGLDFSTQLFDQITALGAEFELDIVNRIEKKDNTFIVHAEYHSYETKTIIIATGSEHKKLNIEGEDELSGKGVSYCAVCDGMFYKGKDITVVGGSDTALQYALLLSNYGRNVYLCMRRNTYSPSAEQILIDKVEKKSNVKIMFNVKPKKIIGEEKVEELLLEDTTENKELALKTDAIFVAIGEEPKTDIFNDFVERQNGYIITNENMETKTDGIYAVGDVRLKMVRQLTTAEADAAIAAYNVSKRVS
ncbi:MAG: FAD-dependent oxidoreductase [Bacillales bacterium]|nr:FAD-dependent oxidoreductase [Bacillales bacterium]